MRHNKSIPQLTQEIIEWIQEFFRENGPDCNAVLGISGGKDSSVCAALCCAALGRERVIGVLMPQGEQKDISASHLLCSHLGIRNYTLNVKDAVDAITAQIRAAGIEPTAQSLTNIPPRIRMTMVYAVSQSLNGRVVNTSNWSEDVCGYFTKYGDGAGDFSPLGNLTVREVVAIGDYLGLPRELTHKVPIDGLNTNPDGSYVTDEQVLGVAYADVDRYIDGEELPADIREKIAAKERANAFKLKPMPRYKP